MITNNGDETRILLEDYYVDFAVTKKTDKGLQVTGGISLEDFFKEPKDPSPPFTKNYVSIAGGLGKLEFSNQDDASSLSGYANDLAPGGYGIDGFSSLANAGKINAYGKTDIEIPAGLIRINYTTPKIRGFTLGFSVAKSIVDNNFKPDPEPKKNTIIFDFDDLDVAVATRIKGTVPVTSQLSGGLFKSTTLINFSGTKTPGKQGTVKQQEIIGRVGSGMLAGVNALVQYGFPQGQQQPPGTLYQRTITGAELTAMYPGSASATLTGTLTGGSLVGNTTFTPGSDDPHVTATILPPRNLNAPSHPTPRTTTSIDETEASITILSTTSLKITGTDIIEYYIKPDSGAPNINGTSATTDSYHFTTGNAIAVLTKNGTATKTDTQNYEAGTKAAVEGLRGLRATDPLIVNRVNSIKAEIAKDFAGTEVKARTADYSANSIGFNYHFANFNFGAAITNYEKKRNVQLYDDAVIGGQYGGAFTTEAAAIQAAIRSINGKYSMGWVGRRSHISYQNNWLAIAYSTTTKTMAVSEIAGTKDLAARDTLAKKADADNVNETIVLSFNYGSGQLGYSTQSEDYPDPKDPTEIIISMVKAITLNHNVTEHIALYGRYMIGEAELDPAKAGFEESIETQAGIAISF